MKSRKFSKPALFGTLVFSTLALVAWSPPSNEDIVLTNSSALTPAVVICTGNELESFSATATVNGASKAVKTSSFRGFIAGKTNYVGSGNSDGFSAVIGSSNVVNAVSSIIAGDGNTVANGTSSIAPTYTTSLGFSAIFGQQNFIPPNCDTLLVSGISNTVNGSSTFVSGNGNTLEGATSGALTYQSAAIGQLNSVNATHGYAIGNQNAVSGDRSAAIGSSNTVTAAYGYALGGGLSVGQGSSVAVGMWNATMLTGDVFVVGNGNPTTRSTALRVTKDGGVLLGKAQGDISMGIYGN